jgi:hypothetical protein
MQASGCFGWVLATTLDGLSSSYDDDDDDESLLSSFGATILVEVVFEQELLAFT